MHGSLALHQGVLYVGRCAKTARVAAYDLDGHRLESGFTFRDEDAGRSMAAGLAVDEDHRVWVADAGAGRVRAFTLFGKAVVDVGEGSGDERGQLGRPVDVAVSGTDDELVIAVASAGRRRHALQLFHPHTGRVQSLRPEAGPRGVFRDLRGVTFDGDRLLACEGGAGAIRVYREGELHWSQHLPAAGRGRFVPTAAAALRDGRFVVTCGHQDASAVLLVRPGGSGYQVLAAGGVEEGQVDEPSDVVVCEDTAGGARIVVIDRAGQRVQVFTLEGRCYGAFPAFGL